MISTETCDSKYITSALVDVVDSLNQFVTVDGLASLISACLEITKLDFGSAQLLNKTDSAQMFAHVPPGAETLTSVSAASLLAIRAISTLESQFAFTGEKDKWLSEYAIPLRVRAQAIGVVRLYGTNTTPSKPLAIKEAEFLCDIAASTIDQTNQIAQARCLVSQLQSALDSRVVLEQAKGVLAERYCIDFPAAFQQIRNIARREQRSVHQVAADTLASIPRPLSK